MTAPERIWAGEGEYWEKPHIVNPTAEYIRHDAAALAASPVVQDMIRQAACGQWVPTTDRLPEKPGIDRYEHVRCLIVVNGEIEIGMWNCEHLCWDDDEGDDYRYDPDKPTHWMPLPAPPAAIRARKGE